ncbi:hypothetical protein BJ546DRAFT_100231 [Cryomyces antarcticus]
MEHEQGYLQDPAQGEGQGRRLDREHGLGQHEVCVHPRDYGHGEGLGVDVTRGEVRVHGQGPDDDRVWGPDQGHVRGAVPVRAEHPAAHRYRTRVLGHQLQRAHAQRPDPRPGHGQRRGDDQGQAQEQEEEQGCVRGCDRVHAHGQVHDAAEVLVPVLDCGRGLHQLRPRACGQHGEEDQVCVLLLGVARGDDQDPQLVRVQDDDHGHGCVRGRQREEDLQLVQGHNRDGELHRGDESGRHLVHERRQVPGLGPDPEPDQLHGDAHQRHGGLGRGHDRAHILRVIDVPEDDPARVPEREADRGTHQSPSRSHRG